jgi:hypothetical protein
MLHKNKHPACIQNLSHKIIYHPAESKKNLKEYFLVIFKRFIQINFLLLHPRK